MKNFIKHYALEVYTVLAMLLLLVGGLIGDLTVIQKYTLAYTFLFILHEWEEGHYPGGFTDMISGMIGISPSEEIYRASCIPTGILLTAFTYVPFFLKDNAVAVLVMAFLGILEGIVHAAGIRLWHRPYPYTPGMVTAELEMLLSLSLFAYLSRSGLASWPDYLLGSAIMLACFFTMRKTLTMMVGIRYGDLPKMIRKQWKAGPQTGRATNFPSTPKTSSALRHKLSTLPCIMALASPLTQSAHRRKSVRRSKDRGRLFANAVAAWATPKPCQTETMLFTHASSKNKSIGCAQ